MGAVLCAKEICEGGGDGAAAGAIRIVSRDADVHALHLFEGRREPAKGLHGDVVQLDGGEVIEEVGGGGRRQEVQLDGGGAGDLDAIRGDAPEGPGGPGGGWGPGEAGLKGDGCGWNDHNAVEWLEPGGEEADGAAAQGGAAGIGTETDGGGSSREWQGGWPAHEVGGAGGDGGAEQVGGSVPGVKLR